MYGLYCDFYGLLGIYDTIYEANKGREDYWQFIKNKGIEYVMTKDEFLSYEEAEEKARHLFDNSVNVKELENGL